MSYAEENLDPRWEWISVGTVDEPDQWVKGHCRHLEPTPVYAHPNGDHVANLCPDCDKQLPVD
ncbi:hypothetical protein OG301_39395 (plasmid) [Streptomyces platensis]|uniref:hypothetical protein n=1 Tax=Streptomyces platensis TaxID=58346 RepID=UPI002ED41104|nr:hypothetical protein OG301_39395 [Streptomyces platensis]